MPRTKKVPPIPELSDEETQRLVLIADRATVKYVGQLDELESAIGMLFIGRLLGWRVLLLIHNKRTIKKYEEILGIDIREEFPDEGLYAYKSRGLEYANKLGNFWKVVSGDVKVEDRRELIE